MFVLFVCLIDCLRLAHKLKRLYSRTERIMNVLQLQFMVYMQSLTYLHTSIQVSKIRKAILHLHTLTVDAATN